MSAQRHPLTAGPRLLPLFGIALGALGGGVYWLGALLWPTSVAVVVSMLATSLLARHGGAGATTHAPAQGWAVSVFAVLIKYNALMALSAANLPFALPPNLGLGFIMIAGQAASRALLVSMLMSQTRSATAPVTHADLAIALSVGFAPAALIGIPGLVGLAAAIVARFGCVAFRRRSLPTHSDAEFDAAALQVCEIGFYLGAIAAWAYV
jgi:hypothetical protein